MLKRVKSKNAPVGFSYGRKHLKRVVRLAGVEPATYRLGGDRSIQVSYNRNYMRCIIANPSLLRNPYQPHCALYFMASCLEILWLP